MIISWKEGNSPVETEKAYGFKIKHNDVEKIMWIPKSQIKNKIKSEGTMADVPDGLYDKKFKELF